MASYLFYNYCNETSIFLPDVNECAVMNKDCGVNMTCKNTIGSYECSCTEGYGINGETGNCISTYMHRTEVAL